MEKEENNIESTMVGLPAESWDVCSAVATAEQSDDPLQSLEALAADLNEFYGEYVGDTVLCQGTVFDYGGMNHITVKKIDGCKGELGKFTVTVIAETPILTVEVTDCEYVDNAHKSSILAVTKYFIISAKTGYEPFQFTLDEECVTDDILQEWNTIFDNADPAELWGTLNDYYKLQIKNKTATELHSAPLDANPTKIKDSVIDKVAVDNVPAIEYILRSTLALDDTTKIAISSDGSLAPDDNSSQKPVISSKDVGYFAGVVPFLHQSGLVDLRIAVKASPEDSRVILIPFNYIKDFSIVNG